MSFAPQWASAPGETLKDILERKSWSPERLSDEIGISIEEINRLLVGARPVDLELAQRLSDAVGASPTFWMVRDVQYRDDLRWLSADQWANELPVAQMTSMGWIPAVADWRGQIAQLLEFFDVVDADEWRAKYGPIISEARLRVSASLETNVGSLAAWLRRGEQIALLEESAKWDPSSLPIALESIRSLTKQADPSIFLPELKRRLAIAGVVVVLLKAPVGSPISGAARVLSNGTAVIQLSGRFLSDDQFWFTVFHEAGHLALHGDEGLFLDDESEMVDRVSEHEREANDFALLHLFGGVDVSRLSRVSTRDVARIAGDLAIAPGIVVGCLQHSGVIGYNQLNGLKRRYVWNGPTLESRRRN